MPEEIGKTMPPKEFLERQQEIGGTVGVFQKHHGSDSPDGEPNCLYNCAFVCALIGIIWQKPIITASTTLKIFIFINLKNLPILQK